MNLVLRVVDRSYDAWIALQNHIKLQSPNTERQYRRLTSEFLAHFNTPAESVAEFLLQVRPDDARRYIAWCRIQPAQPGRSAEVSPRVSEGTVYRKVMVFYSLFQVLLDEHLVTENPFAGIRNAVKSPKTGHRRPHEPVPFDRVRALLEQCPDTRKGRRDRAVFALLFGGGLRVSEVTGLRLSDLQIIQDTLVLRLVHTKAQEPQQQVIEWEAATVKALVEQRRGEGASERDWLVVNYVTEAEVPTTEPLSVETVRRRFKSACKAAKLDGVFSPHCARATAITKLLSDGVDHKDVQEFSRHSSILMVERYDKRRTSIKSATAKKLRF